MNKRYLKGYLKFALLIIFFGVIVIFNLHHEQASKERPSTIPPTTAVKYFVFGYSEAVSDSWWISALQNFIGCEQDRGGSSFSPSAKRIGLDRTPACSKGWLYHALNLITDLAPRFRFAFRTGPIVLSTVVDDIDGASSLYLKAIKHYPTDWVILSRAASHFAIETEDRILAANLYLQAVKNGAPLWMALYASKLNSQDGVNAVALRILMQFRDNPDLSAKEKDHLEMKIKDLQKKREGKKPSLNR